MTPASPILLLVGEALPPLRGWRFASTELDPVPIVLMAGALGLYLWGVARNNRLHPRHPWPRWKTWVFVLGIAIIAVAILSSLGVYDTELFWVHMVQHLMLVMVAPAFCAAASPIDLAWRATSGDTHRWVTRVLRTPVARLIGHPIFAYVLYAVMIPVTHLTAFYNYTLVNEPVHNMEHIVYVFVGYLFWRQILGSDPNRDRLHPALKGFFLFMAVPIDTFVGLSLANETKEIFPAYLAMHRTWGPSLVNDLHLGGIIMWVAGDSLMMLALIPVIAQWVRLEDRRSARVDRQLDTYFADQARSGAERYPVMVVPWESESGDYEPVTGPWSPVDEQGPDGG